MLNALVTACSFCELDLNCQHPLLSSGLLRAWMLLLCMGRRASPTDTMNTKATSACELAAAPTCTQAAGTCRQALHAASCLHSLTAKLKQPWIGRQSSFKRTSLPVITPAERD